MGRKTREIRIDLRKVEQAPDGLLMLRLSMAVNDIAASNTFLKLTNESSLNAEVREGLAMHAVRLQIAYLSAGLELLKESSNCEKIEQYLSHFFGSQRPEVRQAFELIKQAIFNDDGTRPYTVGPTGKKTFTFTSEYMYFVKAVRDTVTFHYDKSGARRALRALVSDHPVKIKKIVEGDDINSSRLVLADAVIDRNVCEVIWGVNLEDKETLRGKVDEKLEWCQKRCVAFVTFGANLCIEYFAKTCQPTIH